MPALADPLCPASSRADAALRDRLASVTDRLVAGLDDDLLAIVLGGSLARGQGMVLGGDDGPRVLSDIDLYVVRRRPRPEREGRLRAELVSFLESDGLVLAPLDLAFVAPDYFASLGSALPARQLALGTRTLHEGPGTWARPESVGRPDDPVDPDDAPRPLLTRMADALLQSDAPEDWFTAVHRAKRWIDAPLAWVAAHGHYHPDRGRQLDRLEELTSDWTGAERAWRDRGISVARDWLETIATRELDPPTLRLWPATSEEPDRAVRAWVWPFARAMFRTAGRAPGAAADVLAASARRGLDLAEDVPIVDDWLRRRPWPVRLRTARRWHPLAPVAIPPWWRYASGGAGHERVYAAAALLYAGHEDWTHPLHDILPDDRALRRDGAAALGRLWADWILGGGRR